MEKLKTNKDLIEVIEARKKLATVIKKYKDGWKQRITITDFKQPVMFLLRKNMNIDFFEANKQNSLARGRFRYTHSGGKSMEVNLDDNYLYTVKYGNGQFKAYVHHEDYAFPLPQNPILYMTAFKDAVQHSLSAELKWKAVEKSANAKIIWSIVGGMAVIAGGFILYTMLKPEVPKTEVVNVAEPLFFLIPWRRSRWIKMKIMK